jgi:outer membrane protein insertion porin family
VRLHDLDIFDAVKIMVDAWPLELPGTTNVVIEVAEAANPLTAWREDPYSCNLMYSE